MTRQRLILAAAALVALVGAFGVGRYSRAPAVVHDETHATTTMRSVATTEKHAEAASKVVAVADVDTTTKVVTRWLPAVAAKDGCPAVPAHVEQEATTERHSATTRTSEAHRASNEQARQETQAQQSVVTLHTVEARPNWSVSLLPGIDLTGRSGLPYHAVVGASLERRILGPLFVGLHGNSAGVVGAIVRMEF